MKKFLTVLLVVAMLFTACISTASAVPNYYKYVAGLDDVKAEAVAALDTCYKKANYDSEGLALIEAIKYVALYGGSVKFDMYTGGTYTVEVGISIVYGETAEQVQNALKAATLGIAKVPTALQNAKAAASTQFNDYWDLVDELGVIAATAINTVEDDFYTELDLAKTVAEVEAAFDKYIGKLNALLNAAAAAVAPTAVQKAALIKAVEVEAVDAQVVFEGNLGNKFSNETYKAFEALLKTAKDEINACATAAEFVTLANNYLGTSALTYTPIDGVAGTYADVTGYVTIPSVGGFSGLFVIYKNTGSAFNALKANTTSIEALKIVYKKALELIGPYDYKTIAVDNTALTGAASCEADVINWSLAPAFITELTTKSATGALLTDMEFVAPNTVRIGDSQTFNLKTNKGIDELATYIAYCYELGFTKLGALKQKYALLLENYTGKAVVLEDRGEFVAALGCYPVSGTMDAYDDLELSELYAYRLQAEEALLTAKTTEEVNTVFATYVGKIDALETKNEKRFATAQADFMAELKILYNNAVKGIDLVVDGTDYDAKVFLKRYYDDLVKKYNATVSVEATVENFGLGTMPAKAVFTTLAANNWEYIGPVAYEDYGCFWGLKELGYATKNAEFSHDKSGDYYYGEYIKGSVKNGEYYASLWAVDSDIFALCDIATRTAILAEKTQIEVYAEALEDAVFGNNGEYTLDQEIETESTVLSLCRAGATVNNWVSFFSFYDIYLANLAKVESAAKTAYNYLLGVYNAKLAALGTADLTGAYAVKFADANVAYNNAYDAYMDLYLCSLAGNTDFYTVAAPDKASLTAAYEAWARLLWEEEHPVASPASGYFVTCFVDVANDYNAMIAASPATFGAEGNAKINAAITKGYKAIAAATDAATANTAAQTAIAELTAVVADYTNYLKDAAAYLKEVKQNAARYFEKYYGATFTSNAADYISLGKEIAGFNAKYIVDVKSVEALKLTAKSALTKGKAITVSWTVEGNTTAVEGYEIWKSTKQNSGYKKAFTQVATKNTYKNTKGLVAGNRYYYKVRAIAYAADGTKVKSDWSNKAYRIFK